MFALICTVGICFEHGATHLLYILGGCGGVYDIVPLLIVDSGAYISCVVKNCRSAAQCGRDLS